MYDVFYIKRKKYLEQIKEDIDDAEKVLSTSGDKINFKSFDLHDKLNETFWDEDQNLRTDIREQLMQIAHDFYNTLDISEIISGEEGKTKEDTTFETFIKDVLFVGSLASFNYSSYADVDLHLLMDEKELTKDNELALNILKKYFTECKNDWNLHHANLTVEGFDCELYVQDVNEENAANGVYSLFNDEWIKHPEPMDSQKFDRAWVEKKALDYIEQIDNIEDVIKDGSKLDLIKNAKDDLDKIKDKIVKGRRDSLAAGEGEMNKYNILFKILRRSGHIEKINNLKVDAYDMLNSIRTTKKKFKKESVVMTDKKKMVKESSDPIEEFADMYGEKAANALRKYLAKRSYKSVEDILTSDDEFEKFGNWAYEHLGIDVYANFKKYDTGGFYKSTSTLLKNPTGDEDGFDSDIDDRTYDVMDGDDDNYDSPFEESMNESLSLEQKVRDVLTGPEDDDYYMGKLVNSEDMPAAVKMIVGAIRNYREGSYNIGRVKNAVSNAFMIYGNDFPPDVEEEAIRDIIDIANELTTQKDECNEYPSFGESKKSNKRKPISEENEFKKKLIIGMENENETIFIIRDNPYLPVETDDEEEKVPEDKLQLDPNDEANKVLKAFGQTKWIKDPEYSYWYFIVNQNINDIELRKKVAQFENSMDIEWDNEKKNKANESESAPKVVGKTWDEFVKNIADQTDYEVDSAYKTQPDSNIDLLKKSDNSKFTGEVISYSDGSYELMIHNIKATEESKKQQRLNEEGGWGNEAQIQKIKSILNTYFEVNPITGEDNPEYNESFSAQEAIDEIANVVFG